MKIKFRAVGSNSVSIGYCKASINSHISKWCDAYSVTAYTVSDHGANTVILEFPDEKSYTLFVLTWAPPSLSYLTPELIEKSLDFS